MDFYGCHFEYAGEFSRKYGLIIASIDTERISVISGKSESVSIFNKRNQARYDLGDIYTEVPLTFEMEVISDEPIDGEWRRKIQKWLFNQKGYQKLYIDRAEDFFGETFELVQGKPKRSYLNCKFVNPEKIEGNGGIIGFKFEVECDSRMAWQDPISTEFQFDGGVNQLVSEVVLLDTDANGYTYPKVTVVTGDEGGTVVLINNDDDESRDTTFSDLPPNTQFVINGVFNYVSNGYYENFINRNFPRLLDGENIISIAGDVVSVTFEWQNMRYL